MKLNNTTVPVYLLLFCLGLPLFISGCGYATAMVNNVGLRERAGDTRNKIEQENNIVIIPIDEYEMDVDVCVVARSGRGNKISNLGNYKINLKDITWRETPGHEIVNVANGKTRGTIGYVTIEINGEPNKFEVISMVGENEFVYRYKKWYWYPTQTLRVITYPVDAVIGIFWYSAAGIAHIFN